MKATMRVWSEDGWYYSIVKSKTRQGLLLYYSSYRKRRSIAIRDGLKFADEHNIEITNRKEFEG